MNTFKLSSKLIYSDKRSSIEDIHNTTINDLEDYYNKCGDKEKELKNLYEIKNTLNNNGKNRENIIELRKINDEINKLEDEIYNIKNKTELIDYLFLANPFIENFEMILI